MRIRIRFLFIALLLAALGYGAFWHFSARHMKDTVKAELSRLEDKGFTIKTHALRKSGFPYKLALSTQDMTVIAPRHGLPWQAGLEAITLFTHPWTPGHLVARLNTLSVIMGSLSLTAPDGRASILTDGGQNTRLDIDLGPVRLSFPASQDSPLAASRLQIHLRFPGETGNDNAAGAGMDERETALLGPERADIALSFKNLALGRFAPGAPAPAISQLVVISELHGQLPQPVSSQSLTAWRDAGGTLEIKSFILDWGTVQIDAEGSLTLDEDMRPLGAMTLKVVDAVPLVHYLAAQKLIDKTAVPFLVESITAITTMESADTPHNALQLPLTIQNGQILLGPFPIAAVGPVTDI